MNYLSPSEILYIHSRVTVEIGGRDGVNDSKILKRAVSYIKNNEVFPTLFDKAGALVFAIAKKRPFTSSNLPTAVMTMAIFLKANKKDFDAFSTTAHEFFKNTLSSASVKDISAWLSRNCV